MTINYHICSCLYPVYAPSTKYRFLQKSMSSCCSGCGVGLPSFPISPMYNLLFPSWRPHTPVLWRHVSSALHYCVFNHGTHATTHCVRARLLVHNVGRKNTQPIYLLQCGSVLKNLKWPAWVTSPVDLQWHYIKLVFHIPDETSNFGASVEPHASHKAYIYYCCIDSRSKWTKYRIFQQSDNRVAHRRP